MKAIGNFIKWLILGMFAAILLGPGLLLWRAYEEGRILAPPTEQEQRLAEKSAEANYYRWQVIYWALTVGGSLAAIGGGIWVFTWARNKSQLIYVDKHGMYPIIQRNAAPLAQRIRGVNAYYVEDPNLAVVGRRHTMLDGGRVVGAQAFLDDGIDSQQQSDHAMRSWGVQGLIAQDSGGGSGRGPNATQAKQASGQMDYEAEKARIKLEQEKIKLQKLQEAQAPTVIDGDYEVKEVIDARGALNHTLDEWRIHKRQVAVIGQTMQEDRRYAEWKPEEAQMVAIVGAQGTGKTSNAGASMVTSMIIWGWNVAAFEPPSKSAWKSYGVHLQRYPTTAQNLMHYLDAVWVEYERRAANMQRHGFDEMQTMPAEIREPNLGIVLEEFGMMYSTAIAGVKGEARKALENRLDNLFSMVRHAGMFFVVIDQRPKDWPSRMKGNFSQVISYKMPMHQGGAAGMDNVKNLKPRGEFRMDIDGEAYKYNSWHVLPMAAKLQSMVPATTFPQLAVPQPMPHTALPQHPQAPAHGVKASIHGVVNGVHDEKSPVNGPMKGHSPEVMNAVNGSRTPPAIDEIALDLGGLYDHSQRSWDAFSQQFFHRLPDATQADLRRAMVVVADDGRDVKSFNGPAFNMYHLYSPNGKNYVPITDYDGCHDAPSVIVDNPRQNDTTIDLTTPEGQAAWAELQKDKGLHTWWNASAN